MIIVAQFSWDDIASEDFGNPARQAWRQAVAEIAAKAHEKLPECAGRIDSAVKIVLAGDVTLMLDGTAKVASQSHGTTAYRIMHGHCDCRDYEKAPHHFCTHRLAAAITRRAQELIKAQVAAAIAGGQPTPVQLDAPTASLPEARVSITLKATLHGHEALVTLRGVDFLSVKAQVEQASQWLSVQAPALPPTQPPAQGMTQPAHEDISFCRIHNTVLKRYERNGYVWYSHKLTNGQWCCGK
jgi:hypothetical protein